MIHTSIEALLQFMQKHNYDASIQKETDQVYTILKFHQREYPLFLRIFEGGQLLQLLAFIPSHLYADGHNQDKPLSAEEIRTRQEVHAPILADLARLLHLMNKELDIPGFGMDEANGAVFYRLMIPTPKKKVESDLLLALIKTIEHVCPLFSTPIEAVTSGKMTLNQILEKANELENKE